MLREFEFAFCVSKWPELVGLSFIRCSVAFFLRYIYDICLDSITRGSVFSQVEKGRVGKQVGSLYFQRLEALRVAMKVSRGMCTGHLLKQCVF